MKLSIKDFRERGGSPWYHPLTDLKGIIRKTSRYYWLPLGDKAGVGVLSARERELVEECFLPCKCMNELGQFTPDECTRFNKKHGYFPCEFKEKNEESLQCWEIIKKDRGK